MSGGRARRAAGHLEFHLLVLVTLGLVAFGLVMVYSASSGRAAVANGGQLVARQQGVLDTDPVSVADVQAMPIGPTGLGGGVEIVVEQRQIIRGNANDPRIRELLLNSVASSHSGARLESLEALGRNLDDQETRAALIRAMVEEDLCHVETAKRGGVPERKALRVRDPISLAVGGPFVGIEAVAKQQSESLELVVLDDNG